jgi:hypothetical protein
LPHFLDSVTSDLVQFSRRFPTRKPDPPSTLTPQVVVTDVVVTDKTILGTQEVITAPGNSNDVPGLDPLELDSLALDLLLALNQQVFDPPEKKKTEVDDQIQQEEAKDKPVEKVEIFGNEKEDAPSHLNAIAKKNKKKLSQKMSICVGKNSISPNLKVEGSKINLESLKADANMRRAAALNLKKQKKREDQIGFADSESDDVSGWLFGQTEACFEELFQENPPHEEEKNCVYTDTKKYRKLNPGTRPRMEDMSDEE